MPTQKEVLQEELESFQKDLEQNPQDEAAKRIISDIKKEILIIEANEMRAKVPPTDMFYGGPTGR